MINFFFHKFLKWTTGLGENQILKIAYFSPFHFMGMQNIIHVSLISWLITDIREERLMRNTRYRNHEGEIISSKTKESEDILQQKSAHYLNNIDFANRFITFSEHFGAIGKNTTSSGFSKHCNWLKMNFDTAIKFFLVE